MLNIVLLCLLGTTPQKAPPKIIIANDITSVYYVQAKFPSGMKMRVPVLNGLLPQIEIKYTGKDMTTCEFSYLTGIPFIGKPNESVNYKSLDESKEGDVETYLLSPNVIAVDHSLKRPTEVSGKE